MHHISQITNVESKEYYLYSVILSMRTTDCLRHMIKFHTTSQISDIVIQKRVINATHKLNQMGVLKRDKSNFVKIWIK